MHWFFTADLHLNHAKIMLPEYCNRPFKNVEEMDDALITNWNHTVTPNSQIVMVGDFAWAKKYDDVAYRYIRYLKGNIIWIKGNHDNWMKPKSVDSRHIYHKKIYDTFVVCCHYPMRSWNQSQHGSLQLHGHCHGEIEPWQNQLDVGVDNAYKLLGAYRPFELSEIIEIVKKQNQGAKGHDYHTRNDDQT